MTVDTATTWSFLCKANFVVKDRPHRLMYDWIVCRRRRHQPLIPTVVWGLGLDSPFMIDCDECALAVNGWRVGPICVCVY